MKACYKNNPRTCHPTVRLLPNKSHRLGMKTSDWFSRYVDWKQLNLILDPLDLQTK